MEFALVLILGLGLVVVGAGLVLWGRARRAKWRSIPKCQARQARPGAFVKVEGRLGVKTPRRAPLADTDCAYYRLSVLWKERRNSDDDSWSEQFAETEYAEGWFLEDASGRIEVQPEDAPLRDCRVLDYTVDGYFNSFEVPPTVISRYAYATEGKPTRLRELRLEVGAQVLVVGQVALGPRGPVLVGGEKLEIREGTDADALKLGGSDLLGAVLLAAGVLLCVAGGAWMLEEPEPVPVVKDEPLRPLGPARAAPGPE